MVAGHSDVLSVVLSTSPSHYSTQYYTVHWLKQNGSNFWPRKHQIRMLRYIKRTTCNVESFFVIKDKFYHKNWHSNLFWSNLLWFFWEMCMKCFLFWCSESLSFFASFVISMILVQCILPKKPTPLFNQTYFVKRM